MLVAKIVLRMHHFVIDSESNSAPRITDKSDCYWFLTRVNLFSIFAQETQWAHWTLCPSSSSSLFLLSGNTFYY